MSERHKVVLINGAPGVGKSWLAKQIVDRSKVFQSDIHLRAKRIGFADSIRRAIAMIMGYNFEAMDDSHWTTFKNQQFNDGTTGRDLMIEIGNGMRRRVTAHWVYRMVHMIEEGDLAGSRGFLWVVDDWGFPDEFEILRAHPNFDLLTVYIDEGDGHTSHMQTEGELRQFVRDSRFDLSRFCSIRAANSTSALQLALKSIKNRGW